MMKQSGILLAGKRKVSLVLLVGSLSYGYEPSGVLKGYLEELKVEAKKENKGFVEFDSNRGKEIFFTKKIVDGKEISCVTCHSNNLRTSGVNSKTNKSIEPLSPSVNKTRLTDLKEMKKWLKRNFNDVYRREGTAQEKGDVLTYIYKN
jgi:hypothetical protein